MSSLVESIQEAAIAARGASAGGLLVAGSLNLEPELFDAAVTTHLCCGQLMLCSSGVAGAVR